jgi:hypothetical protein
MLRIEKLATLFQSIFDSNQGDQMSLKNITQNGAQLIFSQT